MDELGLDVPGFLQRLRRFPEDLQRLAILRTEDIIEAWLLRGFGDLEQLRIVEEEEEDEEDEEDWDDWDDWEDWEDWEDYHYLNDGTDLWGYPQDHKARATARCLYLHLQQPPPRSSAL
ncbi:hypothetical protein V8C44DRAFT_336493 [Trichoderma aethiopicum]